MHLENIPDPLGREIRRKQREFNALRAMKFSKLSNANRFKKEAAVGVLKHQSPINYTQYTTFDQIDNKGYQSIDSKNASSSKPVSASTSEVRKASFHKKASRTQVAEMDDALDQFRPKAQEENEYASDGTAGRLINKQQMHLDIQGNQTARPNMLGKNLPFRLQMAKNGLNKLKIKDKGAALSEKKF